jgi:hypothetical protein
MTREIDTKNAIFNISCHILICAKSAYNFDVRPSQRPQSFHDLLNPAKPLWLHEFVAQSYITVGELA